MSPFEIMQQDTDHVIMLLDYYIEKGDEIEDEQKPKSTGNEHKQGKFDGFWDF